jgi:hypothetical protein
MNQGHSKMSQKNNKNKSKKLKPRYLWIIKRKDSNDIYMLDSFYWCEADALRRLKESMNGAFRYVPEDKFEIIKVRITQV